jgi:hypothetical protein
MKKKPKLSKEEQLARAPLSPDILIDALQDVIHDRNITRKRKVKARRVKK